MRDIKFGDELKQEHREEAGENSEGICLIE